MKTFPSAPYYDDFEENKKFYRILFRPGYAVQARELTQLQTNLQNQIKRHGDHIFKEGAMVIPGQMSIDTNVDYVKLQTTAVDVTVLEGKTITGSSGITALVLKATPAAGADPATLLVRYKTSASDTITKTFVADESISYATYTVTAASTSPTGVGSMATIEPGVYYVGGNFVYVEGQSIVLDKFSNTPSKRVGLLITEQIITPEDDESLLDNAQGSYNYAAPGADRYQVTLTLTALPLASTDDANFIELLRVDAGFIRRHVMYTEYSEIEKTLARRTYDESGSYTVRPFTIDVREHRNNDRGPWATSTVYVIGDVVTNAGKTYVARTSGTSGATAPTHTANTASDGSINWEYNEAPYYNRGIYTPANGGDASKLAVGMSPGKAYVQGFDVEKIATEYVTVDKARESVQVSSSAIPTSVGNYIYVTNVNNLPPVDTFGQVTLYAGMTGQGAGAGVGLPGIVGGLGTVTATTGSAAVTGVGTKFTKELKVGSNIYNGSNVLVGTVLSITDDTNLTLTANGAVAITGAAFRFNTAVGTARVSFIEWDNGTIGTQTAVYKLGLFDIQISNGYDFNRDVKSVYFNVSSDTNLSFTADVGSSASNLRLVGAATASASTTITGAGTSFVTDLRAGDYISLGGTIRRVVEVVSQTSITVDSSTTVAGVTIDRINAYVQETNKSAYVFPLSYSSVKSVRSATNTKNTLYTVYQKFTGTVSASSPYTVTFGPLSADTNFASADDVDNYILVDNDATAGGGIINVTGIGGSINVASGTNCIVTLSAAYASRNVTLIAAVEKKGTATNSEKTKTLVMSTAANNAGGLTQITKTTADTAAIGTILLGKADGFRLVSVKMKSGTFASPSGDYTIDITDRYDFDNGQRDTHYDLARIVLKASFTPPVAPIQITFEYFDHGNGDYFTVNSYSNIAYEDVPSYKGVSLRDVIDFRPRINDAGTGFSVTSLIPKRGVNFRADFQYYLARKTKLAIDINGNFFAIDGVSALNPGDALDPSMGMVLYNLTVRPYTFSTTANQVKIDTYDNKRYTMRDIGRLEKRIDNLEYYTSLSLLEQQTESLDITDSNGESRFKNGFIVDGFTGHNTGDTESQDYMCSIDMENAELRPFFTMNNVNLTEATASNSVRAANNYKLYGDVITLPVVDNIPLVTQAFASRTENINPFAVFTFLGNVNLTPSSDDWFDTDRQPDIVNNVEGNFNTVNMLAQRSGILGTVWNAWQTQWVGTSVSRGTTTVSERIGGSGVLGGGEEGSWFSVVGGIQRTTVTETLATQIGQTRTGTKTSVVAKVDRQVVADRVLSTAVIPYIRSRNILVQVGGLKPNTRFYPFFDNVDITAYCTPASQIEYVPAAGTFDSTTNVGVNTTEAARRIDGDTQVCLNKGDVVFTSLRGGTSYTQTNSVATAVVVGTSYNPDTDKYYLQVVNIKGTFLPSDTITGSNPTQAATAPSGSLTAVTVSATGDDLVTNFNGEVHLLFNIPNTDAMRFRTGSREFKLLDGTEVGSTSRARATYRAEGILETRQATINAVRNGEIVSEQVSANQTITQITNRVLSVTEVDMNPPSAWYDPLAQTFLVQSSGGAFLSKVDVFFASKDSAIPVNLEIRECVNGYPGSKVLPFSRVSLKPEQVNLSTTLVQVDGVPTPSYDTPTTFTFPSPVYVEDNTEYALVLSSDSNNYRAWISQVGDQIPGSTRMISEQPYLGSLFKSQNASTWTADQTQDLKFTIYRAQFATNTIGNVELVNDILPYQNLEKDPFEIRTGSTKVRVWQRDHGIPVGTNSRVVITNSDETKLTGVAGTGTISVTLGSTSVTGGTTLDAQLQVGSLIYNASGVFVGKVSAVTTTTATLAAGAAVALAAESFKYTTPINGIPTNEIYNGLYHDVSDVDLDSYCITVTTAPTSTGYAGGSTVRAQRNIQFDAIHPSIQVQSFPDTTLAFGMKAVSGKSPDSAQTPYVIPSDYSSILANETNVLYAPAMVASEINESVNGPLNNNKSLRLNVTMSTTNDAVSPVIDTHRLSVIAIGNKVNAPSETNLNVASIDYNVLLSGATGVTVSGNQLTTTTQQAAFKQAKVGKYITITGATSGTSTNLVTAVAADGTSITFATAISSIVGNVTLTQREMFVDDIAPVGSSTYSKYVTKRVNLATPSTFLRVRLAAAIPPEAVLEVYYKTAPVGSTAPLDNVNYTLLASDAAVEYVQIGSNRFIDMTFSSGDLPAFDAVQVKIAMKSTNTSAVPRIKDLRVIACA